jgi:hypothetical protein
VHDGSEVPRLMKRSENVRFIAMGLGAIGLGILRAAHNAGFELVGAVDSDLTKVGKDVGEVGGFGSTGVRVVATVAEVADEADVVLHATSSALPEVIGQLKACMDRGMNVVSTCEELCHPWRQYPDLAWDLDEACRRHGITVLGTGINPGFAMDTFVLAASVPCASVRSVHSIRVLDASMRRPALQRKVGVGLQKDVFWREVREGRVGHVGLGTSAWMLSDRLGLGGEVLAEDLSPVFVETGARGDNEASGDSAAGVYQVAVVTGNQQEVVRLELTMAVGVDMPRDEVFLDADPPVHVVVPGGFAGDSGTAGVVINAARQVVSAKAGLMTMADVALPHSMRNGSVFGGVHV